MIEMSAAAKSSSLTIDRDSVAGSVAVTGSVTPGDETSLKQAMEAARDAAREADGDVVIILTQDEGEQVSAEGDEADAGLSTIDGVRITGVTSPLRRAVASAVTRALGERESMVGLIDLLSPSTEILPPPTVLQARRNAAARVELLKEYGGLKASEVADLAGSTASNRSALATRWRKEGRVFVVSHQGTVYYPMLQFGEDGRPLPLVADVLEVFAPMVMGEWEVALWFTARNGWLDDRRPVDLLAEAPEAVLDAARHEVDEIAG